MTVDLQALRGMLPLVTAQAAERTRIGLGAIAAGGGTPVVIAGPCAVEDLRQLLRTARRVKAAGAHGLRGGAFKPRSSPYSFQGLGEPALEMLAAAKVETGELPLGDRGHLLRATLTVLQTCNPNLR